MHFYPDKTANGEFSYSEIVAGKTLLEHSNLMNLYLVKKNWKWPCTQWPPKTDTNPGTWGTDINICRIGYAVLNCDANSTLEEIAKQIHLGWSNCYKYWYVYEPWTFYDETTKTYPYTKPYKDLEDKYTRAFTEVKDLDKYQKNILMQMAAYVKKECL